MNITIDQLEHVGESLITIKGTNRCLGDLFYFPEHGTFCPSNGKVPVSKEAADIHNKALDAARIEGIDHRCAVGMGDNFYFTDNKVQTFIGTVVSESVRITGDKRKTIHFNRKGMEFKGVLSKNGNNFFAKRIK